jgi:hypothetical protein
VEKQYVIVIVTESYSNLHFATDLLNGVTAVLKHKKCVTSQLGFILKRLLTLPNTAQTIGMLMNNIDVTEKKKTFIISLDKAFEIITEIMQKYPKELNSTKLKLTKEKVHQLLY